jgi:Fur family ferric uptake transcriptional regulator
MPILSKSWTSQINSNGYRLTTPRRVISEIIFASDRALTPTEIFIEARTRCEGIGLVTVYRTLEHLDELGLVERVHHEGDCQSYIARQNDHQHLLICRNCHRVIYFNGDDFSALMKTISETSGFQIQDHWFQLLGVCPDCQKK